MSLNSMTPRQAASCMGKIQKKWISYREKYLENLEIQEGACTFAPQTLNMNCQRWFNGSLVHFRFSNFALACTIIPRGVVQENLLYYNTYYIIYYIYYNIYNKYLKAGRYILSLDFTF